MVELSPTPDDQHSSGTPEVQDHLAQAWLHAYTHVCVCMWACTCVCTCVHVCACAYPVRRETGLRDWGVVWPSLNTREKQISRTFLSCPFLYDLRIVHPSFEKAHREPSKEGVYSKHLMFSCPLHPPPPPACPTPSL